MNRLKKLLAFVLCVATLLGCCVVSTSAAAVGTEANPENANNKFFSAANCYLLNTDLAAGDKDGYWYVFTADTSGILCVDAVAKDANGANTNNHQVTVWCNGKKFTAFSDIYTRPIAPFKVNRGDVVTIHMTAKPDSKGNYPKLKIYCNVTIVYGNTSEPVPVKSDTGFVANVQAGKTVVYQDATNGGRYGGKGITIAYNRGVISKAEVTVNNTVYKDTDNDGVIELMLPGDPNAMIAVHPVISIYNGAPIDCTYFVRVVDSAKESSTPFKCNHSLTYYGRVDACHKSGRDEYWRCKLCNTCFTSASATTITDPSFLVLAPDRALTYVSETESTCAKNGVRAHWYCTECKKYYSDSKGATEVTYSSLKKPLKTEHSFEFTNVVKESTVKEQGSALYTCKICKTTETRSLPLLERWMRGDLNNDGIVNSVDINLHRRVLVGYRLGSQGEDAADFNDDGELNAMDSYSMRLSIAGN